MDLTFLYRTFVVLLCLNVTISTPVKNKDNVQNGNTDEDIIQSIIKELKIKKTYAQLSKAELQLVLGTLRAKYRDEHRKLVRYELLEKRHVNYTDYAEKQPPIDPNDGRSVTTYLNFQRNKLDHVPGAIETGFVGNSFEEQYSLIVESHEKIFRGYSGMLDQNRKEEANHFISEEAILALTKGDF